MAGWGGVGRDTDVMKSNIYDIKTDLLRDLLFYISLMHVYDYLFYTFMFYLFIWYCTLFDSVVVQNVGKNNILKETLDFYMQLCDKLNMVVWV